MGERSLASYRGRWLVFFSHPADFTPVCTSEFVRFQRAHPDVRRPRTATCSRLSVDSLSSISPGRTARAALWRRGCRSRSPRTPPMVIAPAYGMLQAGARSARRCAATFVIDPAGRHPGDVLLSDDHGPQRGGDPSPGGRRSRRPTQPDVLDARRMDAGRSRHRRLAAHVAEPGRISLRARPPPTGTIALGRRDVGRMSDLKPVVHGFFEPRTAASSTWSRDPATRRCAIIDPVLDFDEKSGATATRQRRRDPRLCRTSRAVRSRGSSTPIPMPTISPRPRYLKGKTGAPTAIGERSSTSRGSGRTSTTCPDFPTDGSQWDRLFADGERFKDRRPATRR